MPNMNREIKFRVYAPLGRKFLHSYKNRGLAFSASRGDSAMEQCGCYDLLQCIDFGFIIQQFTGLLDKNGKEIYEGDIVEFYLNGKVYQDMVVFENFGWYLVNDNGAFPLTNGLEYKIIGNTFEQVKL